jgi:SpoVK/Ycf46/Vps4 family AAA+-type ATPase
MTNDVSEQKFNVLIETIIKELQEHEELYEEIPNDQKITEIIKNQLDKEIFKEYQAKINSIYHKISENSKYKIKPLNKVNKSVKLSIHSKFLLKEILNIMYKLIPEILNSSTQKGFNVLSDPDEYIDITLIFRRAFKFFKSKLNEGRCDGIVDSNLIIKDIQQAHKDGVSLDLKSPPEYKLIPNSAKFNLDEKTVNFFSKENLKLDDIDLFDEIIIEDKTCEILQENIIIETRFLNFLSYFANLILIEKDIISNMKRGLPIYHIRIEQLRYCAEKLKEDNCMKKIYETLNHQFLTFADSSVDMSKGFILYGPPRTGKTFTTSKIIDYLKLFQIYDNLAASDFSHPYQGQAEKMVESIAKRTEILPWQLCVLFIDEIDSLAPSRSNSDTSNSQASLIGQFLTNIDGSKKKPNMLIIGTTNRLEKMDQAFNERMDIKVFLGVPNCEIRKNWIYRKLEYYLETKKNDELFKIYYNEFLDIVPDLVNMTINFTADAMKKSLDQYLSEFHFNTELRSRFQNNDNKLSKDKIVLTFAEEFQKLCERDNIKLGKYTLPKMIYEIPSKFENDPEYLELVDFIKLIKSVNSEYNNAELIYNNYNVQFSSQPTRRILIDLDTIYSKSKSSNSSNSKLP